jgi:hypothetical protein
LARPKDKRKEKAIETLQAVKNQIMMKLSKVEPIKFINAELYVVDQALYYSIMQLQDMLEPFRDDTKKNSVYSVHKIVNIVNAQEIAASYSLSEVKKSSIIKDRGKIADILDKEKEISKNFILKMARERIENEDLEEFMKDKIMNEANAEVEREAEAYEELKENFEAYEVQFMSEPIKYAQINWVYKDSEGKQKRTNKHLSKENPNIFILDESIEFDRYIRSNKTNRFLNGANRMYGRIYAKRK